MINAIALLAAVGDASAFAKARDLAAWLGLTPRQHSTGGKTKMLDLSKRGKPLLAQAADPWCPSGSTALGREANPHGRMAAAAAGTVPSQRRSRGARCQAGAHRLGCAVPRDQNALAAS
jgi:hypothetical protein